VRRRAYVASEFGVAGAARSHQKQVLGLGELFQLVKGDVLELSANVVVLVVLMLQVPKLDRCPRREIPLGLVRVEPGTRERLLVELEDRKSTRLNSSHVKISYAVFCLKKKI